MQSPAAYHVRMGGLRPKPQRLHDRSNRRDHRGLSDSPQKITFADMGDMGVRRLLIYCSDCRCSHLITMSGDRCPDEVRLSNIELAFRLPCLRQADMLTLTLWAMS
jgi:hypothetical protein